MTREQKLILDIIRVNVQVTHGDLNALVAISKIEDIIFNRMCELCYEDGEACREIMEAKERYIRGLKSCLDNAEIKMSLTSL